MNLPGKEAIVSELHNSFFDAKIIILTDYKGLNVKSFNELRKKLRESGVKYHVVKNTLLRRAAIDTELHLISDQFKGSTAIALSYGDIVAPAKILCEFTKENEKLTIKSGVMKGKVLDFKSIKILSNLPSKDVLLSHLFSSMSGVPTFFVRVLSGILLSILNALNAIKTQKENE